MQWAFAWDEYVRGHVVSEKARDLIQSFLLKTMAASGKNGQSDESEADETEDDADVPPFRMAAGKPQELLCPIVDTCSGQNASPDGAESFTVKQMKANKKNITRNEYER